jgi:Ca-activated chloride channel family protein
VNSYRLLGFENRGEGNGTADTEIEAGQTVTALYEVVPAPNEGQPVASDGPVDALKPNTGLRPPASIDVLPPPSAELLTVKLRYRPSATPERAQSLEKPLLDSGVDFHNASSDLKFAAAVARFGMLLRRDVERRDADSDAVIRWAEEGSVGPSAAERAEFIQLVRKAESLLF